MRFDELIAPLQVEHFLREYHDRRPIHIPAPADAARHGAFQWERLNALLSIRSHWTQDNVKLIMNSHPIAPEFYMDETIGRADPAKIDVFFGMGASLVANNVHEIAPEVRAVCNMLGQQFSGRAGANAYCSFGGVQAFATHFDLHDVFAIHCEGEKIWRLYENRAENPITHPPATEDAQARIDAARGRLVHEVKMQPGDVLYIPRGWYHDALASSNASLHLSFGVLPYHGRLLFQLLEEEALNLSAFRAYLPDARTDGGDALKTRLSELANTLASIMTSPRFLADVANKQGGLREIDHRIKLPNTPTLDYYARTAQPAHIEKPREGIFVTTASQRISLGPLGDAAEWLLSRPAFSIQELAARFPHHDRQALGSLAATLSRIGLIEPYSPQM